MEDDITREELQQDREEDRADYAVLVEKTMRQYGLTLRQFRVFLWEVFPNCCATLGRKPTGQPLIDRVLQIRNREFHKALRRWTKRHGIR